MNTLRHFFSFELDNAVMRTAKRYLLLISLVFILKYYFLVTIVHTCLPGRYCDIVL